MTDASVPGVDLEELNRLVLHHAEISTTMVADRTSLESALIPVTNYILVSAAECWFRHPEMVRTIEAAMPAEEIGRAGRRPGMRVNSVHVWSAANIYLTGRKILTPLAQLGLLEGFEDAPERTWTVLDFADRVGRAYRGDGHPSAWSGGFVNRPYATPIVQTLVDGVADIAGDDDRGRITRFLATLYGYLFLLYFDTRVGTADTGPYPLPDGRVLVVRDFYRLAPSLDLPWSATVAAGVPYRDLTAALVLDGVDVKIDDWGTMTTTPGDWAPRLTGFALFTTDTPDRTLRPVSLEEIDGIQAAVRKAQAGHYRAIAAMSREEKIDAGAFVYFSFLRPFAEVAGVADELDWTTPRDSTGPLYDILANLDLSTMPSEDPGALYYAPFGAG